MNRRHALRALALASCTLFAPAVSAAEAPHWSYEGHAGPARWGKLGAVDKVCGIGNQQSPIDIVASTKADLPKLDIAWGGTVDTILNNGHTIQVNAGEGSTLTVGSEKYKLVQFHFHRPSEHKIDGKSFAMEVHFVHATASGGLGVVGVLMTAGQPNATFSKIVAAMPVKAGPPVKADTAIDPNGLLPAGRSYYSYEGSLTTPPCSETVSWMLLTDPIEVAEADIAAFAKLYAMNARPAQKTNRRYVLKS
jgi:carbonic anhydrase